MLSQQAQDFGRSVPDPLSFVKAGSGNETRVPSVVRSASWSWVFGGGGGKGISCNCPVVAMTKLIKSYMLDFSTGALE